MRTPFCSQGGAAHLSSLQHDPQRRNEHSVSQGGRHVCGHTHTRWGEGTRNSFQVCAPATCVGARFPTTSAATRLLSHLLLAKNPLRAPGAERASKADEMCQGREKQKQTNPPKSELGGWKEPWEGPCSGTRGHRAGSPAWWPSTGVPRGGCRAAAQRRAGVEGPARACGPAARRRAGRAGLRAPRRRGGSAAPVPQPRSLREEPARHGRALTGHLQQPLLPLSPSALVDLQGLPDVACLGLPPPPFLFSPLHREDLHSWLR